MFEDKLPQGAPTSPYLFNMVVAQTHLPTILKKFGGDKPFIVTVYADNMTISTQDGIITEDTVEKMIETIESKTPFKVNRSKTRLSLAKHGSPKITGLSIGKKTLGTDVERTVPQFVTVPQKVQRRARGLLHQAIYNHELRAQALGMVAHLINVYMGKIRLPHQISKPYEQLLAVIKQQ